MGAATIPNFQNGWQSTVTCWMADAEMTMDVNSYAQVQWDGTVQAPKLHSFFYLVLASLFQSFVTILIILI